MRRSHLAWLVLVACGPTVASGGGSGSSGHATGTSSEGPGGSTFATATTDASTSTSSTSSSSTESSSSGDGSTGEASVCDPQPQGIGIYVRLDAEDTESELIVVDTDCLVADVEGDESSQRWRLACDEADGVHDRIVEVQAELLPPLPIVARQTVHLVAHRTASIDLAERLYLVVRDADGELVVAWYGGIDEPDDVDPMPWYAPFEFMFDDNVCTAEPLDPPDADTNAFIEDPCPSIRERAAFMVVSPWAMGFVYDDTGAPFGDYEVRVPWADTQTPIDASECGQTRSHGSVAVLPMR